MIASVVPVAVVRKRLDLNADQMADDEPRVRTRDYAVLYQWQYLHFQRRIVTP